MAVSKDSRIARMARIAISKDSKNSEDSKVRYTSRVWWRESGMY